MSAPMPASGVAANPPPPVRRRHGQWGRLAPSPARNLRERLALRQDEALAFPGDLPIPGDTTHAERNLKVHQKGSGCFPSDAGAGAFVCLRGSLATRHKQGLALLATRATVSTGQPLALDVLQFGTGEDRHSGDAVSSGNPCAGGLVCL